MNGLTREIGRRIESIGPEAVGEGVRPIVSGLVGLALTVAEAERDRPRSDTTSLGVEPLADASALASAMFGARPQGSVDSLMNLGAPVVGAALATAVHRPCSGAMLGAAILAGCELGLLLAEMVGDDAAGFGASTATCAAVSAARVLDLRGGRLVSAIGIGASSSVGAAAALDAAWRAGKSASNGVLAALLAEAGFTGPADAIEHPRGLLGAVFDVPPEAGTAAGFGNRIGLMKSLVPPATRTDGLGETVAGMWEMGRASELVAAALPDRMRR